MGIIRIPKTNRPYRPRRNDIVPQARIQARLENKILSICQLYKDGKSLRAIAFMHKVSHESIRQILLNHKIYYKYEPQQPHIGNTRTNNTGYVQVFIGIGEPGANKSGWILEHRLIMAQHLGRPLQFWEIIHHNDRNKANNALSNLEITTSAEHATCLRCPYYEFFTKTTGLEKILPDTLDKY